MLLDSEMKQNLYTSLRELGTTESAANLYVTSLTLGPSPIAALAEHLAIPRPNVYKLITALESHGLAKFSERKRYTRTFVVEPPTTLLEKLRQRREAMADLDHTMVAHMPDLLALYHQGETPTKIRLIEGREQFLKVFYQILDETKDTSQFFGSAADFIGFISWDEENKWIKTRLRKNITIQALLLPSTDADALKLKDAEELRETRVLRAPLPFVTSFQLFANKVLIWQPKAPLAVLVEDEYIVQMLRSIFTMLWSQSS